MVVLSLGVNVAFASLEELNVVVDDVDDAVDDAVDDDVVSLLVCLFVWLVGCC